MSDNHTFVDRFEHLKESVPPVRPDVDTLSRRRSSICTLHRRAVFGLLLAVALPVLAEKSYVFTTIDVPVPDAFQTSPTGINDKGQIAGYYFNFATALDSHGFVWSDGRFSTWDFPSNSCCTDFLDINNRGQIVGYGGHVGFVFSNNHFSTFQVPGSDFTTAIAINNRGDIVGDSSAGSFLFQRGAFSFITNVNHALGINDSGQIVGTIGARGYVLTGNVLCIIEFPGANHTSPAAINDKGTIVGTYDNDEPDPWYGLRGFILEEGEFSTILFPGSFATRVSGLNNRGQLVGQYFDGDLWHAFLATPAARTHP